jgi:hypothetical protein
MPAGRQQDEQRSFAFVFGGAASAFKAINNRSSVPVAHAPFPLTWAAPSNHHFQHIRDIPGLKQLTLRC